MGEALEELKRSVPSYFKDMPAGFIEELELQFEQRAKEFCTSRNRVDCIKTQLLESALQFALRGKECQYSGTIACPICLNAVYTPRIWNSSDVMLIPAHECQPNIGDNLLNVNPTILTPTSNSVQDAKAFTKSIQPKIPIAKRADTIRRLCGRYNVTSEQELKSLGVELPA